MEWPTYSIKNAEEDFNKLTVESLPQPSLNEEFMKLRGELISKRDEIFDEFNFDSGIGNKQKYTFDLSFGLAVYEVLGRYTDIKNRDVSSDDMWRFLSIKIIPDIVHSRWNFEESRYYKNSRRIWLKQIWWYIHLSWHQDADSTYEILKNNSTDTIQSMVERPGIGYNINLYREIMKQYSSQKDDSRELLRQVMVLNTAKIKSISPELTEGGTGQYVRELFEAMK